MCRFNYKLFVLLLTLGIATQMGCSTTQASLSANQEGLRQVGALRLPTANGSQKGLSDYRGNVVMLHFLASWCVECGLEIPSIRSLVNNFKGTQFAVVGVAVDDDPFGMQTFVARHNVQFPVLLDVEDQLKDFFQVKELPATIFLDRSGTPILFKDPQSGETTSKIVGARMWDTVMPIEMIAGLVESKR